MCNLTEIETQTDMENKVWTPREEREGGMNWETGTDIYTLLCIRQVTNENALDSTGNAIQCSVAT